MSYVEMDFAHGGVRNASEILYDDTNTQLGQDNVQGAIEALNESLANKLGTKTSSVSTTKTGVGTNSLVRVGNTVELSFSGNVVSYSAGEVVGIIPVGFRPCIHTLGDFVDATTGSARAIPVDITIDGKITTWGAATNANLRVSVTYITTDAMPI